MQLLRYVLSIVLPLASAIPWNGPEPTQVTDVYDVANGGWSPAPTMEPGALSGGFELKERQLFSYATCGFISGSTSRPYTCFQETASCILDDTHSIFGCCGALSACQLPTSCVPHSNIATCDASCAADPYIFKCNTALPYCNQYVLSTGSVFATAWYCSDTPYIDTIVLSAADGSKGTATVNDITLNIGASPTTTSTSASSTQSSITPTTTVTITSGSSSPTSQPSTSNPTSSKSSTPVGAIVGGVIGGIALIAAIAFGIWFFRRSKRMNNSSSAAAPPPAASSADPGVSYYGQPPGVAPAEKEHYAPDPNSLQPPQAPQQTVSEIYSPPHSPDPPYHPQPVQQPYMPYPPYAEVEGSEIGPRAGPGHY